MSEYDQHRGRRGGFSRRDFERSRDDGHSYSRDDSRRRKRDDYGEQNDSHRSRNDGSRDNRKRQVQDEPSTSERSSKYPKRGGGDNRGRGRGRKREEFFNVPITRQSGAVKQAEIGKNDEKLRLCANYFQVKSNMGDGVRITMYDVKIEPQCDVVRTRYALIHGLKLGMFNYDGSSSIYLMNKLEEPTTIFDAEHDYTNYLLTFKETREILTTDAMFLQIMNLIIRAAMRTIGLQLVGRNFYDANAKISIEKLKLDIWPGVVTSIRQHEQNLLLCCDNSFKFMRRQSVYDIINECRRQGGDYQSAAKKLLVNTTVLTAYNNKTYRVNDITWDENPLDVYDFGGIAKNYITYYRERYGIDIRDGKQPLLMSKSTARRLRGSEQEFIRLVPELCRTTGMTDSMRSNFDMMREIANHTRMSPFDRVKKLMEFNKKLLVNDKTKKIFDDNQLTLDNKLVEFDGRRLEQQKILFGNNKVVNLHKSNMHDSANFTRELRNHEMFKTVDVRKWAFLYVRGMDRTVDAFLHKFLAIADSMGLHISRQSLYKVELSDDRSSTYCNEIAKWIERDLTFMMIAVRNKNCTELYKAIKTQIIATTKIIIPHQVITEVIMRHRSVDSVATKIVIQVNSKLGGIPWNVNIPFKSIMIIGFDVSHHTSNKSSSYGAMVAYYFHTDIDNARGDKGGNYFSIVCSHKDGGNISDNFGTNAVAAVNRFKVEYGELPGTILIYRDGVGDGSIEYVLENEVKHIESNLSKMYDEQNIQRLQKLNSNLSNDCKLVELPDEKKKNLKFGFIIVNKKINTRIFAKDARNGYVNPKPGTVVDDVITLPERFDFYLISQDVNQGTVAPTAYNVIESKTLGLKPKHIQMMTYTLCHMYYNWSGTVRVPSVVQYAKKLAFLTSQYLRQSPNQSGANELFYL